MIFINHVELCRIVRIKQMVKSFNVLQLVLYRLGVFCFVSSFLIGVVLTSLNCNTVSVSSYFSIDMKLCSF